MKFHKVKRYAGFFQTKQPLKQGMNARGSRKKTDAAYVVPNPNYLCLRAAYPPNIILSLHHLAVPHPFHWHLTYIPIRNNPQATHQYATLIINNWYNYIPVVFVLTRLVSNVLNKLNNHQQYPLIRRLIFCS